MEEWTRLEAGASVTQYRIASVLGAGGFGITYLAEDMELDREVALKEFFPEEFARRQPDGAIVSRNINTADTFHWALARFADEAKTLAKFRHPNIVRVNHILTGINGTAYIVMDYLKGETLRANMEREGPPSPERLLSIFRQLLDGCEAIHKHKILHRDINPANIMLAMPDVEPQDGVAPAGELQDGVAPEPVPMLIDFGASRQQTNQKSRALSAIVTANYSPPEQYSVNNVQGPPTDIYSLAATVYHMLGGVAPPSPAERHEQALTPIAPKRAAAFPPGFVKAVLKGLELKMSMRPQTIAEWRKLLGPLTLTPEKPAGMSRRAMVVAGGAGVAALAAVGAGLHFLHPGDGLSGSAHPLKLGWTKDFGPLELDPLAQIAASPRGAVIAAHRLDNDGNGRMLALCIDDNGAAVGEWVDANPGGRAHAILPMADGGAYVGGTVGDAAVLARLDANWKPLWRKSVGDGAVKAILPTATGIVVGLEAPNSSGAPLISLDPSGNQIWGVNVDTGAKESVERMIKVASGGYAILGSGLRARETATASVPENYAFVTLVDDKGHVRGGPKTTGLGAAFGLAIVEINGVIYVTGRTTEAVPNAPPRLLMWALDDKGAEKWARWDYPVTPGSGRGLAQVDDVLYLAGWCSTPSHMRFAQIGPNGELVWDSVPQTHPGNVDAVGLAMRGQGDGFAVAVLQEAGNRNRLLVSRLLAG